MSLHSDEPPSEEELQMLESLYSRRMNGEKRTDLDAQVLYRAVRWVRHLKADNDRLKDEVNHLMNTYRSGKKR